MNEFPLLSVPVERVAYWRIVIGTRVSHKTGKVKAKADERERRQRNKRHRNSSS